MKGYFIGIIVWLIGVMVARNIQAKANRHLDAEKKTLLVDVFSKFRMVPMILLLLVVIIFFLNLQYEILDRNISYVLLIVLVVGFLIISMLSNYTKLKKNDFPAPYIRAYLTAATIRFISLIIFFLLVLAFPS